MPTVLHRVLKWLAAAVWYTGAGVLLWKGADRLLGASSELGSPAWPITVGLLGLGLGVLQGRTVFRSACVRNLRRIQRLMTPRPWQFFRPRFFLALAAMIGGAAAISVLAESGPMAAMAVAFVDWLIGFSLLVSSEAFWTWRASAPTSGRTAEETAA